jgi:hypothetical protein
MLSAFHLGGCVSVCGNHESLRTTTTTTSAAAAAAAAERILISDLNNNKLPPYFHFHLFIFSLYFSVPSYLVPL